jgi:hypothetical protein
VVVSRICNLKIDLFKALLLVALVPQYVCAGPFPATIFTAGPPAAASYPASSYSPPAAAPAAAPASTASTAACCKAIVPPPTIPAPTVNLSSFVANGAAAAAFEPAIDNFVLGKSVTDLGFFLYGQDLNTLTSSSNTSSNQATNMVTNHLTNYCSTALNAEKTNCQTKFGVSTLDAQYMQLGDINITSMLSPTAFDNSTAEAAVYLIRNIINPLPTAQSTNYKAAYATTNSNLSSKTAYAGYLATNAILGVALHSFNEMYAMRVAGPSFSPAVSTSAPAGASFLATMESEATRRFAQATFVAFLNATTTTTTDVLREIAAMDAFQQWMEYHRFKQDERIAALLAVSLAQYATAKPLIQTQ